MAANQESQHRRTVRSFVRRTGRVTASQRRALAELWPSFGIDVDTARLDFDRIFGRSAPVVFEIGFGDGETLVLQALQHPEWNFVGVEVHEAGIGHCLLQAEQAGLSNLRLINHDAIEILKHQVPGGSLHRINLYFPDPWPKKRHHKRRIVQLSFLQLIHSRLMADGTMHIATDWENYAEHIDEVLDHSDLFVTDARREHDGSEPLDRPGTKFERRGLRKGHRIWDWRTVRVAAP